MQLRKHLRTPFAELQAWRQFQEKPSNSGFSLVRSEIALNPKWQLHAGKVTSSSPVVGPDGTIYIGTANEEGEVVAVNHTRVLTFYKHDYVLVDDIGLRANFLRGADDRITWLRLGGCLFRTSAEPASHRQAEQALPRHQSPGEDKRGGQ